MRITLRRLLPIAALLVACAPGADEPEALGCEDCNLVMVSLDTLRADHLGAYGYPRDTSPELDAFAEKSLRFSQAFSTARKTAPSHASMFTSLYPTVHGVFMNDAAKDGRGSHFRLAPQVPTLPELLSQAGLRTVAWHGGGNMSASYGFARGFSRYVNVNSYRKHEAGAQREWGPAFRWLEENSDERFFAFLHTYSIHDPYQPPEPYYSMFSGDYAGRIRAAPKNKWSSKRYWAAVDRDDPGDLKHLVDLYDGGIRHADTQLVGPLLRRLERLGLLENTIVVFVSDHGEEFMEHGLVRHDQLYDEIVRVPLIVYLPPRATGGSAFAGVRDARVSLLDLTPTLLELLGIEYDASVFQGRSLVPWISGAETRDRPVYAEGLMGKWGPDSLTDQARLQSVLRVGDYKIYGRELKGSELFELFDIGADPGETTRVSQTQPEALADMRARLEVVRKANAAFRAAHGYQAAELDHDDALVEELRALGYVQ